MALKWQANDCLQILLNKIDTEISNIYRAEVEIYF